MSAESLVAATNAETETTTAVDSLDDEMVKLVAYTIVSLKPDHEEVMDGGEGTEIVTSRMSGEAFASFVLAKYMQKEVASPKNKDVKQPRSKTFSDADRNDPNQFSDADLKYLRVYFVVSKRWPREPRRLEERKVEALRKIGEAIK
jgi:hypothetical protein